MASTKLFVAFLFSLASALPDGLELTSDLLSSKAVYHLVNKIKAISEAQWSPCIGQTQEFSYKRCAFVSAADDEVVSAVIDTIGEAYDVDTSLLEKGGLPVIRYLPGGGAVGVHGDIGADGKVPEKTVVVYLTSALSDTDGTTFFPELDVRIAPKAGDALSFVNVDADGKADPKMNHGVSGVDPKAGRDRLVLQIPIRRGVDNETMEAYAEHVSGAKHTLHMGVIFAVVLGFGGYYIYDLMFGSGAIAASLHATNNAAAMRVVSKAAFTVYGADERI
jgi:hypothetical protein